jgi:CheY-like chemotaxis protein
VPRILVADDNSNIQKMVTLALKDVGIDVVAVPNGEAAVRKLTDSNLDLVLADIFMPVRSGYEVCEFIKQDPRYSHLPVVLLVGAFDPLDEREAQRVGADGILKKPFVPPDPLINMVKGLLAKSASERLVAVSASSESAAASTAEAAPPPLPKRAPEAPRSIPTADFSDIAPEEFVPPVGRLEFEEIEHPVAFDTLLDAPPTDDRDLTVTASRDPVLGEPAFWAHPITDEPAAQPEETNDADALQDHNWGAHAQPLPFGIETPTLPSAARETERQATSFQMATETESEP